MKTAPDVSLLVVDDEPIFLSTLFAILGNEFELLTAGSAAEARAVFARRSVDMILTDQRMPGISGVELLEWVRDSSPRTIRLLMTGYAELEDAVDAINRGQVYRYFFKPCQSDELLQILREAGRTFRVERRNEQLVDELRKMTLELEHRVQERTVELEEANRELEQKNLMLEKLALTDPLTALPNRRAMDRLAEVEIRRRARYPKPMAMGLIDADHFKEINCRYLLPGGDKVLVDLAKILSASIRAMDSLGRFGGEEFMVLAPETNLDGALVLGERIRDAVSRSVFTYKGQTIGVTVSVGFAVLDAMTTVDYDQLKHLAASALAEAKALGRNRSIVHSLPGSDWRKMTR
jgi:diguanylate cyclase (GGDEF)-like protein